MIEKKGLPPAKFRRRLGGAFETAALGADLVGAGLEMLGLSGPVVGLTRPLAVTLRVVARAMGGRN